MSPELEERAKGAVLGALALVRASASEDPEWIAAVLAGLADPLAVAALLSEWIAAGAGPAELDDWRRLAGFPDE